MTQKICIVAIMKNEGKFIKEWISHYLSLGVDSIHIYDNESSDTTAEIVKKIGQHYPISYSFWPTPDNASSQVTAYKDFFQFKSEQFDWMACFDVDEFLVLRNSNKSLVNVLSQYDGNVGAIGVNWLTLSSSGVLRDDYELVRSTFKAGPPRSFGNNRHIKTIFRPSYADSLRIHHCSLTKGRYIHPNGFDLNMPVKLGMTDTIEHSVMQLNHYQVKSHEDFWRKINKGRVSKRKGDPFKFRENPERFLSKLDQNSHVYHDIDFNSDLFIEWYEKLSLICPF